MKKQLLMFGFVIILLGIIGFVSAEVIQGYYTELVLKQGAEIDMNVLEGICLPNYCEIQDTAQLKTITFRLENENKNLILVVRKNKNPEFYSIRIHDKSQDLDLFKFKSDVSLGLKLLVSNEIIMGLSDDDVNTILEKVDTEKLIYYKPASCKDSYSFINKTGDLGGSGWLASKGFRCGLDEYIGECPRISCCGEASYKRGELIVGFKNNTDIQLAKKLIEDYGLGFENLQTDTALWSKKYPTLVIIVPEGEESIWIETLQKNNIVRYAQLNDVGGCTTTLDMSFSDNVLSLNPLPLKIKEQINNEDVIVRSKSPINYTYYWIIGIIVVLVIVVLVFLLFKSKKR